MRKAKHPAILRGDDGHGLAVIRQHFDLAKKVHREISTDPHGFSIRAKKHYIGNAICQNKKVVIFLQIGKDIRTF